MTETAEGPAQGDLFASYRPEPRKYKVDPAKIRRKLLAMLADLRSSEDGSPWPYETTRLNKVIFPQMANWLPEEERERLRAEFRAELERLNLAS
jgi:hypothetical protein